jgi:hypothetical protein
MVTPHVTCRVDGTTLRLATVQYGLGPIGRPIGAPPGHQGRLMLLALDLIRLPAGLSNNQRQVGTHCTGSALQALLAMKQAEERHQHARRAHRLEVYAPTLWRWR